MDASAYSAGDYLKASDIEGDFLVTTVVEVEAGTDYNQKPCLIAILDDDTKWQLKKRDVKNMMATFGQDTLTWLNRPMKLIKGQFDFNGEMFDIIESIEAAAEAVAPPAVASGQGEIPPPPVPTTDIDPDLGF